MKNKMNFKNRKKLTQNQKYKIASCLKIFINILFKTQQQINNHQQQMINNIKKTLFIKNSLNINNNHNKLKILKIIIKNYKKLLQHQSNNCKKVKILNNSNSK